MKSWVYLIWILASVYGSRPRQIDPVSVLLPISDGRYPGHVVNVTLEAFGGCYKWRVQRPGVVKIRDLLAEEREERGEAAGRPNATASTHLLPKDDSSTLVPSEKVGTGDDDVCHNVIVVSQANSKQIKEKSWVFAEDIRQRDSGVKCEVYVARIHHIVIDTTAKSLTVGGVETLKVRAFDQEGNVFTSLEGLRFQWEIENPKIISIASLQNDIYRPTLVRRHIHQLGEQSDIILLKGTTSGRSRVRARLEEYGYEGLETWVDLDVVEPIVAVPGMMRVPPYSMVSIGLKVLRGKETPNQVALVSLPNSDFKFGLMEESASAAGAGSSSAAAVWVHVRSGKVEVKSGVGLEEGVSIVVADQRNSNNTDVSTLYVQEPGGMNFVQGPLSWIVGFEDVESGESRSRLDKFAEELHEPDSMDVVSRLKTAGGQPKGVWYIPVNTSTLISLELLNSDNEQMTIPANAKIDFRLQGDSPPLPTWISANGALAAIRPTHKGFGLIEATFQNVTSTQGGNVYTPTHPIKATQKLVIVDPISIQGIHGGLASPSQGGGGATAKPLIFPPDFLAHLTVQGGSGSYAVHSTNPAVCSPAVQATAATEATTVTVQTGPEPGEAILTIRDETNKASFYRISCLVAQTDSVFLDPQAQQIALKSAVAAKTKIPLRAKPKLSSSQLQLVRQDQHSQGSDSQDQSPLLFTQCQRYAAFKYTTSLPELDLHANFPPDKHELHVCDYLLLTHPHTPLTLQVYASTPSATTTLELEFFAPLQTLIPALQRLNRLNLSPPNLHNQAPSKDQQSPPQLTSARVSQSTAIALASSLQVHITGGPSPKSKCTQTLTPTLSNPNILQVTSHKSTLPNHRGTFTITCLQQTTLTQLTFTMRSSCANLDDSSMTTNLDIGCSLPKTLTVVPDDSQQDYRVELLGALPISSQTKNYQLIAGTQIPAAAEPTDRLFLTCDSTHTFQAVAWDQYRRPIVAMESLKSSWTFISQLPPTANISQTPKDASEKLVQLHLGPVNCHGQSQIIVKLQATPNQFNNDLPNHSQLLSLLSKPSAATLKNSLAQTTKNFLTASFQLALTPQPRFLPQNMPNLVLHRDDWAYRILHQFGSGRSRFWMRGKAGDVGSILAMEHFVDVKDWKTFGRRVRVPSSSPARHVRLVADLVDWERNELLDAPNEHCKWARPLTEEFPTAVDDILIGSEGYGEAVLLAEDKSLLGGRRLSLELKFESLSSLDLEIYNSKHQRLATTSTAAATVQEIETGSDFFLRPVARFNDTDFHPVIAKLINPALEITPPSPYVTLTSHLEKTSPAAPQSHSPRRSHHYSHSLQISQVGRYVLTATKMSPLPPISMELLVHKPLKLTPSELVLLAGGHTWEPLVTGGSAAMKAYDLVSSDPNVVEILHPNSAKPTLKSNNKGFATVTIVRKDDDQAAPSPPIEPTLIVTVQQPSRADIVANGHPLATKPHSPSVLSLPVGRITRLRGTLLTPDHKPFTLGHLFLPVGLTNDGSNNATRGTPAPPAPFGYGCKYAWSTDNPAVVAFIGDEERSNFTEPIQVALAPPILSRVAGPGRLAATMLTLTTGTARVTFSVDCADRQRWGVPFSKWSDTRTVAVVVSEDPEGILELKDHAESHRFSDVRVPIISIQGTQVGLLPDLAKNENAWATTSERVLGEPVRLLSNSQYTFTPRWGTSRWSFSLRCLSQDDQKAHQIDSSSSSCGPGSAIAQAAKTNDDDESSLMVLTGEALGSEASIRITGPSNSLEISVIISEPLDMQVVPLMHRHGGLMPFPTTTLMSRPVKILPGSPRQFKVLLRDAQRRAILPPEDLKLEVTSSHPSVVGLSQEAEVFPRGILTLKASGSDMSKSNAEGCVALVARLASSSLSDGILVCSEKPAPSVTRTDLSVQRESQSGETEEPSLLYMVFAPWTTLITPSLPWLVVLVIGLASLVYSMRKKNRNAEDAFANHHQQKKLSTGSPHRKSGTGLVRDWVQNATPVASRANMSAFAAHSRRTQQASSNENTAASNR